MFPWSSTNSRAEAATTPSDPEEPEATEGASSNPSTLTARRAAAALLRANTRSRLNYLEVPSTQQNPQQLIRSISRSRSPSPSLSSANSAFTYPSTMDAELLKSLVEAAVTAATANQAANNRDIVAAAVNAAAAQHTTATQTMRKPTLPPFDPKNIDAWLRRVNAAFNRLSITDPKVKFANLDEKIPSDQDPVIDDFFDGPPTPENWDAFVAYLKDKHGRTTKQKASSVIEGTEKDGRTPSQLWSVMVDKAGNITLDDVMKEQLLRRLPQDVRRHLRNRMEGKTGKEVAKMADEYYDKEGKLLDNNNASSVNAIKSALKTSDRSDSRPSSNRQQPRQQSRQPEAASFTASFNDSNDNDDDDDDADVNAVRFRQGQKQRFTINNRSGRSASRGRSSNSSSGHNSNSNGQSSRSRYDNSSSNPANSNSKDPKLCFYHNKYGSKAENCAEGCIHFSKHQAGNGRASR